MHVEDRGSGPAVVLLHGTPTAVEDFEPLAATLARRHRVLVPHLPGYGRTPMDRPPYSLEAVIARLENSLIAGGVAEAAFVALSGGAYKAAAIALRGHVRVSCLALLAPVVGLDPGAAQAYRDVAAATRSGAFDPRPSWLDRMGGPGLAARDPDAARRVMAWLDAAPLSVVCDELVATADAADLRPRLRELGCAVLVCAGTDDGAVPLAWSEEVARRSPRGTLERIEGAGHALLIEAPDRLTGLLDGFLSRASASP